MVSARFAVVLLLPFASCVSAELAERERVRRMAPAALSVAVGPVQGELAGGDRSGGLPFAADAGELRRLLIAALGESGLDAASVVFAAETFEEARREHADIYLEPRVSRPPSFRHRGNASSWWASGGLWLVTWIGGLLVADSTYETDLRLEISPTDTSSLLSLGSETYDSGNVEVSFLERNRFLSLSTLQALVMPPFWTSDDEAATSVELTRLATRSVATKLAAYLKRDFERDARKDRSTIEFMRGDGTPLANGSVIRGASVTLGGKVRSTQGSVKRIAIWLNDGKEPTLVEPEATDGQMESGKIVWSFELPAREISGLQPGRSNLLRFEITFRGSAADEEMMTRTLRLVRRPN